MTEATTAGTAKGRKNTSRKKRPSFARPRSKITAKKKARARVTGTWITQKTSTRSTPSQNSPEVSTWP